MINKQSFKYSNHSFCSAHLSQLSRFFTSLVFRATILLILPTGYLVLCKELFDLDQVKHSQEEKSLITVAATKNDCC